MTRRAYILAAVVGLLVAAPAAAQTNVPVGPFRTIELHGNGAVMVRYAPVQQVRIFQRNARISSIRLADRPSSEAEGSGRLIIETCPNRCPMGYHLVVEIDTPDIEGVAVGGNGRIDVGSGFPRREGFAAAVKGSGRIDARAIAAGDTSAAIKGDGDISLGPVDRLTAAVKGKGRIVYRGHPRLVSAITGGGRIEQAD
ncbi:MAG TPA: DUF2807 domain-containing protein [Allosphingosinicella sp.]|nr:DUF2807 domain-containing protein [Allosphingosinicella sp.]